MKHSELGTQVKDDVALTPFMRRSTPRRDDWPPSRRFLSQGFPTNRPASRQSSQLARGHIRAGRRARPMQSRAAVALSPRLAAILRLDMPAADSLSTSWTLRMGRVLSLARAEPK
jgi:hypothetical protein